MIFFVLTALFLVVMPAFCLAALTKRQIELYIAIMLPAYAVWLYLCGMVNCLKLGRYCVSIAILVLFVTLIAYSIYMIRGKKGENVLSSIRGNALTPGLLIFVLGIVFSAFLSFGRLYSLNDEFSHWGRIVKLLFIYDELPIKNPQILNLVMYQRYPLGTSLIGYLFAHCYNNSAFSDCAHIFSMEVLFFSFCVLFVYNTKWKNSLFAFLLVISIFLCCFSLNDSFFTGVYVDLILGVSLAASIYFLYIHPSPTLKQFIYLTIQLSFLVLIKESGKGLAVLVIIAPIAISVIQTAKLLFKKECKCVYKFLYSLIPLAAFLISTIHQRSTVGVVDNFNAGGITLKSIYEGFVYNSNGIFLDIWNKMIDQLFFEKRTILLIPTSYFSIVLVISLVIYIIGKRIEKNNIVLKFIPHIIFFGFLIYSFSLLIIYNFSFGSYLALRLASFDRYISTYIIFSVIICFSIIYTNFNRDNNDKKSNVNCLFFIILFPFLMFPQFSAFKGLFKPVTNKSMAVFCSIIDQILKQNITENDSFIFISQEDSGTSNYYGLIPAVYFPENYKRQAASWGEPQYEGDIWSRNWSEKQIEEMLQNHQYCFLFKSNKYFVDHYSKYFSDVPDKSNVLYRSTNGKFVRVLLKEFVFDFEKASLLNVQKEVKAYADYTVIKGYLECGLLKGGEIELVSHSAIPLWNGSISKIDISLGTNRGNTKMAVKLNNVIVYENIVDESVKHITIDLPEVVANSLSINLTGQNDNNTVILKNIHLYYSPSTKTQPSFYDVSPYFSLCSTNQKTQIKVNSSNCFTAKGNMIIIRSQSPVNNPIPQDGKLILSGQILNKGKTTPSISIGWSPVTEDGKEIRPVNVQPVPETDTILCEDVEQGSNVIYVADASKWKVDNNMYCYFKTQPDCSDIPNFSAGTFGALKASSISLEQENRWKVTLDKPVQKTVKKNSGVRLHSSSQSGGSFLFSKSFKLQPGEKQDFEAVIEGFSDKNDYNPQSGWPKGSKYASIIIFTSSGQEDFIEVQDLKLTPSTPGNDSHIGTERQQSEGATTANQHPLMQMPML